MTSNFMVAHEKTAGRPRENYNLTRFAAYLVAMNGDPIPSFPRSLRIFPADMNHPNTTRPASLGLRSHNVRHTFPTYGSAEGCGLYDDALRVCPNVGCPPPPRAGAVPGCPGARLSARLRASGCRCSCPWSRRPPPPVVPSSSWSWSRCRCPSSPWSSSWSSWPWSASWGNARNRPSLTLWAPFPRGGRSVSPGWCSSSCGGNGGRSEDLEACRRCGSPRVVLVPCRRVLVRVLVRVDVPGSWGS